MEFRVSLAGLRPALVFYYSSPICGNPKSPVDIGNEKNLPGTGDSYLMRALEKMRSPLFGEPNKIACYGILSAEGRSVEKFQGGLSMLRIQKLGLILVLALGMTQIIPLVAAPQGQMPQAPGATKEQAKDKNFKGTIEKTGEKYTLKTASASYELDDQAKAASFEGKNVKVTGTLDAATKTIHVTDIQPASKT